MKVNRVLGYSFRFVAVSMNHALLLVLADEAKLRATKVTKAK